LVIFSIEFQGNHGHARTVIELWGRAICRLDNGSVGAD
jgi:hypothetical protein